jgi:hypothetical protein
MGDMYGYSEPTAESDELARFYGASKDAQAEFCSHLLVAFPRDGSKADKRRRLLAAAEFEPVKGSDAGKVIRKVRDVIARDLGVQPQRVEKVLGRPITLIFEVWKAEIKGSSPRTIVLT